MLLPTCHHRARHHQMSTHNTAITQLAFLPHTTFTYTCTLTNTDMHPDA